ncbi:MAG: hypothetical protein VKK98_09960 [Cyanobacteriota bacterium]|nr:hypothetical protein [Cyanobacteriota bacterium]
MRAVFAGNKPSLLPLTLVTIALVTLPAMALWRWPRPRAMGLDRLLPQVSLLQSFQAAPDRPVPRLWRERLGTPRAERLWRRQRGIWWQFWSRDGDAGPFLGFAVGQNTEVAGALRVNELVVLAPDPLSNRQLSDQLGSSGRQRRGLERRCLERLQREQSVYWSQIGLAELTGPLASLLQQVSQGCLSLAAGAGRGLRVLDFSGETAATSGLLGDPPAAPGRSEAPQRLQEGVLLELEGPALNPLVSTLFSRQLIREPLASRYGIGERQLKLISSVPFRLRLRPIPDGSFQAGLELLLAVGPERRPWASLLAGLRRALLDQDLREGPPLLGVPAPGLRSQTLPAAVFLREDGTVVGGWRWQAVERGEPQLNLFLGPTPGSLMPPVQSLPKGSPLRLRLLPEALNRLGLLPRSLPELIRQGRSLQLELSPSDRPLSRLTGRLDLAAER